MKNWTKKIVIYMFCLFTLFLMSGCKEQNLLLEGDWQLTEVRKTELNQVLDGTSSLFSLSIKEDGRVSGSVACNKWHGHGVLNDGKVYINLTGVTKKRCHFDSEWAQALEKRYLKVLKEPLEFRVENDLLYINVSSDEVWLFLRQ